MRHVQFTLEEAEHARLVALAKHKRQSIADLLRTLIERKWKVIFGEGKPIVFGPETPPKGTAR